MAKAGEGSFVASKEDTESFFSTPSPEKKHRVTDIEFNDEVPKAKQFSIGENLKIAVEEQEMDQGKNELEQLENGDDEDRNELEEFENMQR